MQGAIIKHLYGSSTSLTSEYKLEFIMDSISAHKELKFQKKLEGSE